MLPSLREERAATYSPFLPIDAKTGIVLQVPVTAHDAKAGTITYEDPDSKQPVTVPVTGGPLQTAMEAGLGHALGRARHRLRDGRQGPDRFGQAVGRNLPRARRPAAGRLQLRAVPRRERAEDFQVEGQRPHHRRMAALRLARKPVAVHVSRAEGGQAALFRRHPAHRRRISAIARRLSAPGRRASGCRTRSGTSIPAIRRSVEMPVSFSMLLTLVSSSNAENAETLMGLHRPLPAGRDAADASRIERASANTPSIISATSCCRKRNSATRATPSARR